MDFYLFRLFRCRSKSGNGRGFEDCGVPSVNVGDANFRLQRNHVRKT